MKFKYVVASLALLLAAAQANYVVEWQANGLVYSMAYCYTGGNTSYDVNGDSVPEVFVTDSTSLKVYSGVSRSLIWTIPSNGYTYMGFPYVGNTDGDAANELVLLCYSYSSGYRGKFFVYDCQSHSLEFSPQQEKQGYPSMGVADVDGDNKNEICLVSGTASRILEVYGSDAAGCDDSPAVTAPRQHVAAPNPANRLVRLVLPQLRGPAAVEMIDAAGRVVRRLAVSGPEAYWDCRDDRGEPVPPGVYAWRCGDGNGSVTVCR